MLITGGFNGNYLRRNEVYDPMLGFWMLVANMNIARRQHTATTLKGGTVLVVGEYNGNCTASAELYDP